MFRLRVLGGFALDGPPGAGAPAPLKRRADAALAVLAVCVDLGCTRERLLKIVRITHLDKAFEIHPDVASAI